ncbi:hypothetical protein NMU03_13260 [Allocoprobacillus halotolerans]|uniref:Uncharacterized protein n=1 Tax=Allocoprobacillus halotolerans TaxID=2944914 RepID=A0ABY5HZT4_9FIRM|nr:hypothetical protein [Allocoprobacillus halotolerans]UTY38588.1 hypothetical protein NMU03_13260 [Allocoprobacillus halotolerans]
MSYPFTPLQLSLISGLAIGLPSFLLTLERSSSLSSQGFLKHVISTALPCALTMIIYMLLITFIGYQFHFSDRLLSTYYYLVAGFISFLVVFVVCLPWNRLRVIVASVITVVFYLILMVMHDFFEINSLFSVSMLFIIPICATTPFVLFALKRGIVHIYKYLGKH